MAIHGSVDHRILGGGANNNTSIPISEAFTALSIFMSSSNAQAAGIERIAFNNGGSSIISWWDQSGAPTNNAWAVYRFVSASNPFYMLAQWSNGTFGSSPGNPGVLQGSNSIWQNTDAGGIGFQFALREDGGNPWSGSMNNNGSDTKGTPVWIDGGSRLFVFPRSNNIGGSHNTNKENCLAFMYNQTNQVTSIKYSGARIHYLVDENNFMALGDINYDGSYAMVYFGKFDRRPDITSSLPPYICLSSQDASTSPFPQTGVSTVYGTTGGNDSNYNGGVIYPLTGSPGIAHGVRGASLDITSTFLSDQRFHPNSGFYTAKYDTFPLFIALNETPTYGFLGRISFFNMIFGLPSGATDSTRSRAVFGNGAHASIKMLCPWDGSSTPAQSADRVGRQF